MADSRSLTTRWQPIAALGLVAAGMGLLIAITVSSTELRITDQRLAARMAQLTRLLPSDSYDNSLHQDRLAIRAPGQFQNDLPVTAYRARLNGEVVSIIFSLTTPDGYNGNIDLLIAIHADGHLQAVRVTRHQETPGLGDRVELEKSDWVQQFSGLATSVFTHKDWQLRKHGGQFDQLTGATITATAVLGAVERTTGFFHSRRQWLLEAPSDNLQTP